MLLFVVLALLATELPNSALHPAESLAQSLDSLQTSSDHDHSGLSVREQ